MMPDNDRTGSWAETEQRARDALFAIELGRAYELAARVRRAIPVVDDDLAAGFRISAGLTEVSVLKLWDSTGRAIELAYALEAEAARFGAVSLATLRTRLSRLHALESREHIDGLQEEYWRVADVLPAAGNALEVKVEALIRLLAISVKQLDFANCELAEREIGYIFGFGDAIEYPSLYARFLQWQALHDLKRHRLDEAESALMLSTAIVTADRRVQITNKFPLALLEVARGNEDKGISLMRGFVDEAHACGMLRPARTAARALRRHLSTNGSGRGGSAESAAS